MSVGTDSVAVERPPRGGVDAEALSAGLFVRKSSGLVREVGITGALGLNLGTLSVIGPLGAFIIMLTLFPGANLTIALLGGGILTGLMAFVYTQLASTLPRAGGDYVYHARVFAPIVGAWVGCALLVSLAYGLASTTNFFTSTFVPFGLTTLGAALHIHALISLASTIQTQTGTFVAGGIILLGCMALSVGGAKIMGRVSWWAVILAVLGVIVILLELVAHGHGAFEAAFNRGSGNTNAYNQVIAQARHRGWTPGFTASSTLNALPWAFLIFASFWYAIYIGGEIKRPSRTLKWANFLAIGAGIVLVVGSWMATQGLAGSHFLQASAALQASAPTVYSKISSIATTPQAYAVMLAGDPVSKVIIALAFITAVIPICLAFTGAISRLLFAMSFDRLLPDAVARVGGTRRIPFVALIVTAISVLTLYALVTYDSGFTNAFRNVTLINAAIALMASLAAIALPYRRRDLFEASPKVIAGKWLGIYRIVWFAAASAAFEGLVCYLTLTKGEYSGGYITSSVILLVVTAVFGPVAYVIVRSMRRRSGIDVALAMHELPPD